MDIDASLVRRLVKRQFPRWADLPIQPVERGGWDNRTFRLGDHMTVRLPSHKAYEAQVQKEQQWLRYLASDLPVPIPTPLALGIPSDAYPLHWSIYRWIDGENATLKRIRNVDDFARELAQFLNALRELDAKDGPAPGEHNFYRGGPLVTYDEETRQAISQLRGREESDDAISVWDKALQATWRDDPVWVHGDMYRTNLLVKDGRLCAVIDFGCSAVGDPACDLTIAWTFFFGENREIFRSHLQLDQETWERARGWALWKALITMINPSDAPPGRLEESCRVIHDVIAEHKKG